MIMSVDVLACILGTVLTFSFYNIFIKQFPKRMILLFWVEIITYICFASLFLAQKYIFDYDVSAMEDLIYDFTYTNAPFYILMALAFVGSLLFLDYLLKHFEISLITPLSQVSLLFIAAGYLLMGDPLNWIVILSVIIVFVGAIISSFKKFYFPNPLIEFKNLSWKLIKGTLFYSLLLTITAIITYLVTQQTDQTRAIMEWTKHSFKYLHPFPFQFYTPFYFNLGIRFFIMLFFIISFFFVEEKHIKEPFISLKKHFWFILKTGFVYFLSVYTYQHAYMYIADKNVLGAMSKLAIPTILVLSMIHVKEKITAPKVVGSILILLGSSIALMI